MIQHPRLRFPALLAALLAVPAAAAPPGDDAGLTRGGAGGPLIVVDTLADVVADDGRTSLREAVMTPGPRVIDIRVTGVLRLERPLHVGGDPAVEDFRGRPNPYGDVTILGPRGGDGLVIAGHPLVIDNGVADVVLRYLRFRPLAAEDGGGSASPAAGVRIGRAHRVAGSFRGEG